MREIKFRGKRTDNGEWVEGLYNYFNWVNSLTREFIETTHHILPIGYQDSFKVFPETVGQFTGLTDKNGTRVFEGDVVTLTFTSGEHKGAVVFHNGGFCVNALNSFVCLQKCPVYEFEVIGNIHDNPELMKGDKTDA